MRDYGGMEKVGMFSKSLPSTNVDQTVGAGDLVLYMGSSFVINYDTNHWNFTKLGHIDRISQAELEELLGTGNVTVTLSLKEDD